MYKHRAHTLFLLAGPMPLGTPTVNPLDDGNPVYPPEQPTFYPL